MLIGAGNLGRAVASQMNFDDMGFRLLAIFDCDPEKIGREVYGIVVRSIDRLEEYIAANEVDMAAITIPKEQAKLVAGRLTASGIKAIWNFAHTDLDVPEDVAVENVHLSESLMSLSYKAKVRRQKKENGQ